MKKLVLFVSAIMLCFGLSSVAFADDLKVGVVNVQEVMQKSPQMTKITTELKKQFGDREKKVVAAQNQLKQNADNYNKNSSVMSAADKQKAQAKLIQEQQSLQQMQTGFQQDFVAAQNKDLQALLDQIRTTIDKIATDQKFNLILTSNTIAYADKKMDITDMVIKALK